MRHVATLLTLTTIVSAPDTLSPPAVRFAASNTKGRDIPDLTANLSLQRTLPGRSPGQRR
jgi:hypothetical protein